MQRPEDARIPPAAADTAATPPPSPLPVSPASVSSPASAVGGEAVPASSAAEKAATRAQTVAAIAAATAVPAAAIPVPAAGRVEVGAGGWRGWLLCLGVALLSGVLHALAFPPFDGAGAAFVFAVPLLLLAARRPSRRRYGWSVFGGFWLSWVMILFWLRYVAPPWGLVGAVALAAVLAVFPLLWFMAARSVLALSAGCGWLRRLLLLFGLAGFWIVLEWVRSWLFTGFPWAPLSVSQWQMPVLLQVAAWAGHYGVSFILIFFNLALTQYVRNWLLRFAHNPLLPEADEAAAGGGSGDSSGGRGGSGHNCGNSGGNGGSIGGSGGAFGLGSFGGGGSRGGMGTRLRVRVCPEFYVALLFLMGSILLYQRTLVQMRERVPMFTAAVVQPWIAATLKWEPGQARETLDVLYRLTLSAAELAPAPDVIVWPESTPPYALLSDESTWMLRWTNSLVRETGVPLLAGALAREQGALFNGLFQVDPAAGVSEVFYTKRRLVPFGEYRPLRRLLPFIDKVVPLNTDISAGAAPTLVTAQIAGQEWRIGSLICYEDIFAGLGRESAAAGADLLLVVTNDAWYGESAGAYQHAAHSVLRAVETRRPLLRNGNHGWSGWIDEAGQIRATLTDAEGSIYLRGSASFPLVRSIGWIGRQSFYVRHGDWFVGVCGVLSLWALVSVRLLRRGQR